MMTENDLATLLKEKLADNLQSVVLYGSAATGDRTKKYSDINVLVVVKDLGFETLHACTPIVKKWNKAGNPPPLMFTQDRFSQASDVFPIEFLDIKSAHKVLHGEDPFQKLVIQKTHLRHQLEYELRGKLIQLRERYLELEGTPKHIREMMAKAISTFTVLFKGVLRLVGEEPPVHRDEVISKLNQHVAIEEEALLTLLDLRENDPQAIKQDPEKLLAGLLRSVEAVVDFVDLYQK